jgi:ParB family chromosome partitioning protein
MLTVAILEDGSFDPDWVDALARSIGEVGLLHPVVVTPNGHLIAGARRIEACRRLGWQNIPVTLVDLKEIVRGEFAEADPQGLPSQRDRSIRRALTPKAGVSRG